jgi:hypothetical protein
MNLSVAAPADAAGTAPFFHVCSTAATPPALRNAARASRISK